MTTITYTSHRKNEVTGKWEQVGDRKILHPIRENDMTKVTWSPAQKADAAKIEGLLNEIYPDGAHPFEMSNYLIDNGIGDVAILTRQLQECEKLRYVDKKILDDYVDREYNPENPDFEERI